MSRKKEPIDYVKIFKIADPILQTLFIIYAFYVFDKRGTGYHKAMQTLVGYELLSAIVNIFLKYSSKIKLERYLSIIALVGWLFSYDYIYKHVHERHFYIILGKGPTEFSVFDSILMISGAAIGIWYFSICFREISKIMKKRRKVKRG